MVATSAKLRRLVASFDDRHLMTEDSSEKRLLLTEGIEVTRLGGRLKMPGPLEVAVDRLVGNNAFEGGDRVAGDLEQLPCPRLAVPGDQSPDVEFEPGQTWPALRELAPDPTLPRSRTTTEAPDLASWRAAESPCSPRRQ